MSSDTFSHAISHLRPHSSAPLPQLYAHLCTLLSRYTSGLSLPVTLDTLPSTTTPPQTYHELRVITTRSNPSLHLLQPHNSSSIHHTFFPPHTLPPLPPGTTLRLPSAPTSSDDALSLSNNLFPDKDITHAHLPTLNVLILLPFPKSLPLPHPYETYTLHNIWNLRDLTPPAVYATVQKISLSTGVLTLSDGPDSPPVALRLLPTRKSILMCLSVPCRLLVTAPLVTPTEDGFTLIDTPSSTFFMFPLPSRKRERDEVQGVFKSGELKDKGVREIGQEITVHARVREWRKLHSGGCVVDVGDVDVVVPEYHLEKGDEIVLAGVKFEKRWRAERVSNVSTMLGILYCPFIAKFIDIGKAEALCGGGHFFTAFLRVRVTAIETGELVRLKVEDCGEGKDENCSRGGVEKEKKVGKSGRGVICLKDRGFLQIFGTTKKGFQGMEHDQVSDAVERIRGVVWRVIACCGVEDVPVLTGCLRAS